MSPAFAKDGEQKLNKAAMTSTLKSYDTITNIIDHKMLGIFYVIFLWLMAF